MVRLVNNENNQWSNAVFIENISNVPVLIFILMFLVNTTFVIKCCCPEVMAALFLMSFVEKIKEGAEKQ